MTTGTDLIIDRADHASAWLIDPLAADADLAAGQVLVEVERFALTTNNMSYARAGEFLGYWNFYPAPDPVHGRLPVWGYATVVASAHPAVPVGEGLFGCFTIARRLVMAPSDVTALAWSDALPHRASVHPWYNRYYRVADDPVSAAGFDDLQPALWALFMTGWEIANELVDGAEPRPDSVVLSSASSKTAWSAAHSFAGRGVHVVGLTSPANREFVQSLGCYDQVAAYDSFEAASVEGSAAFVDMAGNQSVAATVHEGFGDRLVQSLTVGGTHRGAGGPGGDLPGPARRFFFIPDVAEQASADEGHAVYHARFADAWAAFAPWAGEHLHIDRRVGAEAMLDAYLAMQAGRTDPRLAQILQY